MTTGFPVPAGYSTAASLPPSAGSGMLWRLRNPPRGTAAAAAAADGTADGASAQAPSSQGGPPLVPVFRASPYSAEAARLRRPSPTARVLFLDDGCSCRAVLAQALLLSMMRCGRAGEE